MTAFIGAHPRFRVFLEHRDDESFHAYMNRRYAKPRSVLIEAGELEHLPFDEQLKLVEKRMRSRFEGGLEAGQ